MKRALVVGLLVLAAQLVAVAKGQTTRITISGGNLTGPIEITDPVLLRPFQVFSGAGTFTKVAGSVTEHTEGFIIDWPAGLAADRPDGLERVVLSFYMTGNRSDGSTAEELGYVVLYEYDHSTETGFVYLPGKGEPWYDVNTRNIFRGRGREGTWLRATPAWNQVAMPLLSRR